MLTKYYRVSGYTDKPEILKVDTDVVHEEIIDEADEHALHLVDDNKEYMKRMRENFIKTGNIYGK